MLRQSIQHYLGIRLGWWGIEINISYIKKVEITRPV